MEAGLEQCKELEDESHCELTVDGLKFVRRVASRASSK
jgi:hypothetical protein